MPKGFFTQGAAVLLSRPATLDELEPMLAELTIVKRNDRGADPDLSGPSLLVAFRPEVNGYVTIDLQHRRWPDHMGDTADDVGLLAAWSTGHFGPFTFPGGLQRAAEQSWSWRAGQSIPDAHRAFVRIRLSYLFGASDDARVMPADCDPAAELAFVTRVARALLDHPAALAYFNPNGELLADRARIDEVLVGCAKLDVLPINLWCNVRMFRVAAGWLLMDSVGMAQLDRRDSEACFPDDTYEANAVAPFLRNIGLYLADSGDVIKDRDTIDGPGGVRWRANRLDDGSVAPPREVLRWFPVDGSKPPRLGYAPEKRVAEETRGRTRSAFVRMAGEPPWHDQGVRWLLMSVALHAGVLWLLAAHRGTPAAPAVRDEPPTEVVLVDPPVPIDAHAPPRAAAGGAGGTHRAEAIGGGNRRGARGAQAQAQPQAEGVPVHAGGWEDVAVGMDADPKTSDNEDANGNGNGNRNGNGNGSGIGFGDGGGIAGHATVPAPPAPPPPSKARPAKLLQPSRDRDVEDDDDLFVARVTVDEAGDVVAVRFVTTHPGRRGDQASSAIWSFRYAPALDDDGVPVRSTFEQPFQVR